MNNKPYIYYTKSQLNGGLTLIELLIGIALVAIIAAIGIPNLNSFINHIRTVGLANELVSDLALARSEAIKRSKIITVSAIEGEWNNGWQVIDAVNDDEIIREHGSLLDFGEKKFNLSVTDNQNQQAVNSFTFGRDGTLSNPAATLAFEICRPDNNIEKSRTVLLNLAGNVRIKTGVSSCG